MANEMNKVTASFLLFFAGIATGCRHQNGNTSITLSESDQTYSMKADFPYDRTRDVEQYMDDRIGRESRMSFVNTKIDGQLSMDDHTSFYIKKIPGHMEIKLAKNKNTRAACEQIKSMCEGIKEVIGGKSR